MYKVKRKKSKYMPILIFLGIITTIIVTTLTLSKYETSMAESSSTKTAIPVMDVSSNVIQLEINPIEQENIYTEKIYNFSVSNNKAGQESEVSMEYTIQIESLANLPLEFELYTQEDVQETNNLFKDNGSVTETIQIKLGEEPHTYKLKIKWREGENSYLYNQTIDYIRIVMNSNQVD